MFYRVERKVMMMMIVLPALTIKATKRTLGTRLQSKLQLFFRHCMHTEQQYCEMARSYNVTLLHATLFFVLWNRF